MRVNMVCEATGTSLGLSLEDFKNLKNKISELVGTTFNSHYRLLDNFDVASLSAEDKEKFYNQYNERTKELVKEGKVPDKVSDFLYQSDVGGYVTHKGCKQILKVIGDCEKFSEFKNILKECVKNKSRLIWR